MPVQPLQQPERLGDRPEVRDLVRRVLVEDLRHAERMEARRARTDRPVRAAEAVRPLEQLFVADREERSAQRRKHRQLIVGPLDRGERGAHRLDLFALVERAAADEHVRDAARLERLDVGPRDVGLPADEPPEQQADVLGRDLDGRGAAPLGDLPAALVDDPVDERADRVRQRLLDRAAGHVAPRVRLGHRQRDDRRLAVESLAGGARAGRSRPAA